MDNMHTQHRMHNRLQAIQTKARLTREAIDTKLAFHRSLILGSASIVGILVSLHNTTAQCLYIRLVFLLSVLLLCIGILCVSISSFGYTNHSERLRKAFHDECVSARDENRDVRTVVSVSEQKWILPFEKSSYIFFACGLLSLVVYTTLNTLSPY